jgi:hypothetical protein
MSATNITKQIPTTAPRLMTRFVAAYYLLTILTGTFVLFFHSGRALAADLILGGFYLSLTIVLYAWSKPANERAGSEAVSSHSAHERFIQ